MRILALLLLATVAGAHGADRIPLKLEEGMHAVNLLMSAETGTLHVLTITRNGGRLSTVGTRCTVWTPAPDRAGFRPRHRITLAADATPTGVQDPVPHPASF